MKKTLKPILLATSFAVLLTIADAPTTYLHVGFVKEANAWFVARRAFAVGATAAVVTTAAVASASANERAAANAAAANANAAAANANAAAASATQPRSAVVAPPIGSIVTILPPGCVSEKLNGIAYERCGSTYYAAKMMGNNLVFVVSQP